LCSHIITRNISCHLNLKSYKLRHHSKQSEEFWYVQQVGSWYGCCIPTPVAPTW
jgi:hypothetical protein